MERNKPNVVATALFMLIIVFTMLFAGFAFGQQYADPISDISFVNWTGSYLNIDEGGIDGNINYGPNNPTQGVDIAEHLLSPVTDPNIHTGHQLWYRIGRVDADTGLLDTGGTAVSAYVYLYQGTTLIATCENGTTVSGWADLSYTLTEGEASNITNYSDLRVRFDASGGGGGLSSRRALGVEVTYLQVPNVSSSRRIFNIN